MSSELYFLYTSRRRRHRRHNNPIRCNATAGTNMYFNMMSIDERQLIMAFVSTPPQLIIHPVLWDADVYKNRACCFIDCTLEMKVQSNQKWWIFDLLIRFNALTEFIIEMSLSPLNWLITFFALRWNIAELFRFISNLNCSSLFHTLEKQRWHFHFVHCVADSYTKKRTTRHFVASTISSKTVNVKKHSLLFGIRVQKVCRIFDIMCQLVTMNVDIFDLFWVATSQFIWKPRQKTRFDLCCLVVFHPFHRICHLPKCSLKPNCIGLSTLPREIE